jgi:hypothetical protein
MTSFKFTGKHNLSLNFQLNLKHVAPLIYVAFPGVALLSLYAFSYTENGNNKLTLKI